VFNIIDANHHTEEWTFFLEGKPPMVARLDMKRTN
jgi:hypothetical protein